MIQRWLMTALAAATLLVPLSEGTRAEETVRVGVLAFGTVNWELDVIQHHGFDAESGIALDVVQLASNQATTVALQSGDVDVIVSDWLWVSRQRSDGKTLTFVPYSSSVGAIMVPPDSPIQGLADLRGRKIAVAGGPLDKSWLLFQGLAKRDHGIDLRTESEQVFGAPPLLAKTAEQGEVDAILNYWHYGARLEARGFRRIMGAEEAAMKLGATGRIAAIGYVFDERWAAAHPKAIAGFIQASRKAKDLMMRDDAEWERLRELIGAEDDATLRALRKRFREGIPNRPLAEELRDTEAIYELLAEFGGETLVGPSKSLAKGTFWPNSPNDF
ncbi:MAG: ABC transporter substrate-binding protein [Kiloniellales bacterium]